MKKYIAIIAVLGAVGLMAAGWSTNIYTNKVFTTSDTRTDTSAVIDLNGRENVELGFSESGCDSIRVDFYIDALYGSVYSLNLATDSLKVTSSTTPHARGILLRGYGTNKIPGVEKIRVRIKKQSGAADDSVSALKYNFYMIER